MTKLSEIFDDLEAQLVEIESVASWEEFIDLANRDDFVRNIEIIAGDVSNIINDLDALITELGELV